MNHPFWGTPTCIFDLKTIFDNLDELSEHDGQVKPQKYTKKISLFKKMVYDFSNYLGELSYFTNLNSSASYGDDPLYIHHDSRARSLGHPTFGWKVLWRRTLLAVMIL